MENFELLGELAHKLPLGAKKYLLLIASHFFLRLLVITWLKAPTGGPDFIEAVKRAFISTLLLAGFQEITDVILFITTGLADKISDMQSLNMFMQMAGEKSRSYPNSPMSLVLGFNDLIVATLSFLSYIILYIARYIMVAVYHFSWVFLSLMAPILLLFHIFSPKITLNLFKSMIEIASWKVVWAVLSAMLAALPFGNAYATSGNYLTVIVLNFVIAISMLCTPLVVKSLVGSGFTAFADTLGPITAGAMLAAPVRVGAAMKVGRAVIGDTKGFAGNMQRSIYSRMQNRSFQREIKGMNKEQHRGQK